MLFLPPKYWVPILEIGSCLWLEAIRVSHCMSAFLLWAHSKEAIPKIMQMNHLIAELCPIAWELTHQQQSLQKFFNCFVKNVLFFQPKSAFSHLSYNGPVPDESALDDAFLCEHSWGRALCVSCPRRAALTVPSFTWRACVGRPDVFCVPASQIQALLTPLKGTDVWHFSDILHLWREIAVRVTLPWTSGSRGEWSARPFLSLTQASRERVSPL